MDKTAIKTFAIESRRKLMEDVEYCMSLVGITKDGIADSISDANGIETFNIGGSATYSIYDDDIKKRASLVNEIKNKGFENVVEEVAYTWFNRIIAIRFMEINNYLPTKTRVLSSETPGKIEPDIITNAFELDLDYSDEDIELIFKLKDENKSDELFRFLFIKQCNKLNDILPGLFEKTEDYMELLLNISFTNDEGFIRKLIDDVPEDDFTNQVEIIGWLYQYYISEKKENIISLNTGIIKKEDIPSATQLFTTNWVVKYMVENSLGRYWIERDKKSSLKDKLEFYFDEAEQNEQVMKELDEIRKNYLDPEEIKFFDPCMGSGHILVYAFEVFMEIYKERGFLDNQIPELILKNNLYGLDIDVRAYQLAYFAILMKAREYDRRILEKGITPNIYVFMESKDIPVNVLNFINEYDENLYNEIEYLCDVFKSAKEFGSLIQIKNLDFESIESKLKNIVNMSKSTILDVLIAEDINKFIIPLINQAKLLTYKYEVVVTNPPYMNKFEKSFKDFANRYYKKYLKDLYSMFIYRNFDFCKKDGYAAYITPFSWMFLSNFEELRKFIINNKTISSLIQLEYNAFTEVAMVPVAIFVIYNNSFVDLGYRGSYLKLSEFKGGMDVQKDKVLDAIEDKSLSYVYITDPKKYLKIPENPIAYSANDDLINIFDIPRTIESESVSPGQNITGNNKKYLRFFWEIKTDYVNPTYKWVYFAKGGVFRKWGGNIVHVVDWSDEALEHYKKDKISRLVPEEYRFKKGITWGIITSDKPSFRILPENATYDKSGSSIFIKNEKLYYYILGLLNSHIFYKVLNLINPTLSIRIADIRNMPLIVNEEYMEKVTDIVKKCYQLSIDDWNDYETSYDFSSHPFLRFNESNNLKEIFRLWTTYKDNQFNSLQTYEIKLNDLFSSIYSVKLDSNVKERYVSIRKSDYEKDIKSFISYSVGCMFGRYSLNSDGLVCAGSEFDLNNYLMFVPDDDNIIPVLDTVYFEDDIVGRFIEFIKVCFGEGTLEENLDFIASALSKSNKPSRIKIRDYFLKNFFKDHIQTYRKCPIYWMFNSGKYNGFNCLIYMHRYTPDLVARVRTDYLHKTQKAIEQNIVRQENIINNSSVATEIKKATKEKNKLEKQLQETREYDEALAHIANQNIEINLDDGVKVNYAKFQKVEVNREGQKTKKINLLKKI